MKRILALLAAVVVLLSFAACGKNNAEQPDNDTPVTTPVEDETSAPETSAPETDKTMGQILLDDFKAIIADNADATAMDIANELIKNEVIGFRPDVMEVSEGWLSGFDAEEIKGFKNGAVFAPMMGSIAFIGYVFELEDGADVDAFMQTLETEANPSWQICVSADETVIEKSGNTVFFLMCDNNLMK
jgi:predicted small lipoprotein YifL